MRDILIYGFGGFGREIASIICAINSGTKNWNILGFIDDGVPVGTHNKFGDVLGDLSFLNSYEKSVAVVMAIASPQVLEYLVQNITNPYVSFPNIVAPTVLFFDEESFSCGRGNVICHNCRISCDVKIGDFNLLNGVVSLGHDVNIGDYNVLQPETRISGDTNIGNVNFFGVRSLVLQGLIIGNYTRIGTGSVIMQKTKDGFLYFGNPAKILNGH